MQPPSFFFGGGGGGDFYRKGLGMLRVVMPVLPLRYYRSDELCCDKTRFCIYIVAQSVSSHRQVFSGACACVGSAVYRTAEWSGERNLSGKKKHTKKHAHRRFC